MFHLGISNDPLSLSLGAHLAVFMTTLGYAKKGRLISGTGDLTRPKIHKIYAQDTELLLQLKQMLLT